MWTIARIDEADFGCEERMPGEPLMVLVTITSDDGSMSRFEYPDNLLASQGLDEGDEWPEDVEAIEAEMERVQNMNECMDAYYNALDEMEEIL